MEALWLHQPNAGRNERIILFGIAGAIQGNLIHPYCHYLLYHTGAQNIRPLPLINGVLCTLPEEKTVTMLARNAYIHSVEENSAVRLLPFFNENHHNLNDPPIKTNTIKFEKGYQLIPWGIGRIGANLVWRQSRGKEVKIAIIDTGVDFSHPDLADNVRTGINLLNPQLLAGDDHGHGTHVAGIIAAVDNDAGVVGIASDASLYPVKALNLRGEGSLADVIRALDWCVEQRMDVVNMSFGIDRPSQALHTAISRAVQAGCMVVAAAGNHGINSYPAAYNEVIAVGAADEYDNIAWFSSRGPEVKLVAPGTKVISTSTGNSYLRLNGTSMAAAHVSGAIAILLKALKRSSKEAVLKYILKSAEVLPGFSDEEQGAGMLRVDRALSELDGKVDFRAYRRIG
ncbi:MAG: S8 family peptidase [Desulfotomaculaceae bacterium]